ncbi:MAG TPA: fused MFS/spermidine synthase [Verrucomicrobiota bacterium]|nr:fused MFS/spermidine synthase [Verrucomicrobiota bacterium]HNU52777.1 fused MFS/spermidine synthase [Verrucomicrobiota bacterium]
MRNAVVALGISSVVTQMVLLREMLGLTHGNEAVLGVMLGSWLLLGAAGAALGRVLPIGWTSPRTLSLLLVLLAFTPALQVVALRWVATSWFTRGTTLGLWDVTGVSLTLLAPYAVSGGLLLTLACAIAASTQQAPGAIRRVYGADSIGSVIGGALFAVVLARAPDHFVLLAVPATLNLLAAAALWHGPRTRLRLAGAAVLGAVALTLGVLGQFEQRLARFEFSPEQVRFSAQSVYGRIVVTENAGQIVVRANRQPIASNQSLEQAEAAAHVAMSQRPNAREVLLVSGTFTGAVAELLKYPQARLTCVELDPLLLDAGHRFLGTPQDSPRVRWATGDARRLLRHARHAYDVVILQIPPPTTAQFNRYYTAEFFEEARQALAPGGVLAFALGDYAGYLGPDTIRMLAVARTTAAHVFAHVLLQPLDRVWFLASDGPLNPDLATSLDSAGINVQYLRRSYLEATLTADRRAAVQDAAGQPARPNTDFHPRLYFLTLRQWLAQYEIRPNTTLAVCGLLLLVFLARRSPAEAAVLASGVAGSTLMVVWLLAVQILHGALYRHAAAVVAVFMAGLAVGAGLAPAQTPRHPRRTLAAAALGIAALSATTPWLLDHLRRWESATPGSWSTSIVLGGWILATAILVGLEFPLAAADHPGTVHATAGRLYAADLIGACAGSLLAGALLIPLAGVPAVCGLAAGLNLLAAGWVAFRRSG